MLGEGWISLEELSISKWEAKSSGSEDGGEGRSLSIQRVVECAKDLALTLWTRGNFSVFIRTYL